MASENAKAVAQEVSENIRDGKRVNLGKIIKEKGYSDSTSKKPKLVTETKAFKDAINPVVIALEEERDEIIKRLKVTRNKAKYRDLIDGLDKVTKNHQLLTGGRTEDTGVKELADSINKLISDLK